MSSDIDQPVLGNMRYDDEGLQQSVLRIVEQARVPVSVDYVRHNLHSTWPTARAILFALALEGKLRALRTTAGWVFSINNSEKKPLQVRQRRIKGGP